MSVKTTKKKSSGMVLLKQHLTSYNKKANLLGKDRLELEKEIERTTGIDVYTLGQYADKLCGSENGIYDMYDSDNIFDIEKIEKTVKAIKEFEKETGEFPEPSDICDDE